MFKNKNFTIGFSLVFVLLINFLVFKIALKKEVDLVEIPVSKVKIYPRSKINESDIEFIEVPSVFVSESFYKDKKDIVDKYNDIQSIIPKGSPFYKEILFEEKNLPEYPAILLNDNQVVYNLLSNLIKLSGNSIVVGQKVDIYTTYMPKSKQPIVDLLVSNVRIIGIKDKKGLDINHPESSNIPHIVLLAIDKDILPLVRGSEEIAKFELYAKSDKDSSDLESIFNFEAKILEYIVDDEV